MITARITQAVMIPRLAIFGAGIAAASAMDLLVAAKQPRDEVRQAARATRIDIHRNAHSDTQRRLALGLVDVNSHRNALDDLDPIASRVLRRQQRETRARRRADAVDNALPFE